MSIIGINLTEYGTVPGALSIAAQVYRTGALDEDVLPGLSEGVLCPTACRGRLNANLLSGHG